MLRIPKDEWFYKGNTIKDISEIDPFTSIAQDMRTIISALVFDLAYYLSGSFDTEKNQSKIDFLIEQIDKYFANRLSLTALADCFDKIKIGLSPYDLELHGFDTRNIGRMMERYADDFTARRNQILNNERNKRATSEVMSNKEEVQRQIEAFSKKHMLKHPIPKTFDEFREEMRQSIS